MISKAPVALGQFPRRPQKFFADRINSALALNRLHANCAYAAIKLPLQVLDIVETDEVHARQQRRKGMPVFRLARRGQRAKVRP